MTPTSTPTSLPPSTIDRVGFVSLQPQMLPTFQRSINLARSRSHHVLALLDDSKKEVEANNDLSERGKQTRIHAMLKAVAQDLKVVFTEARKEPLHVHDRARGGMNSALFADVDHAARIDQAQRELVLLLQRETVRVPKIATDENGHALLATGGDVARLLGSIVADGPLDDARTITLAVARAGPLLRAAVGGEPVLQAMRAAVEARMILTDPKAAEHYEALNEAEEALQMLTADETTALTAAARVLGVDPQATLAAAKEDKVALAAKGGTR